MFDADCGSLYKTGYRIESEAGISDQESIVSEHDCLARGLQSQDAG
jgi:hypothetical protein